DGRKIFVNGNYEYVDYCEYDNDKYVGNEILTFTNDITGSVQIGGIAANNGGYISYSQSEIPLITNCGTIAGLVANNSKKISNSKVVLESLKVKENIDGDERVVYTYEGKIENTLTTSANAVTAGFVARNSGEIFGSYVSQKQNGIALSNDDAQTYATIKANSSVGGFVNSNTGTIKNCYSNVEVKSSLRSSGFVFNNTGIIESCYSSSKIEANSSAHSPFTGRSATGEFQNSGTIDDCYYIGEENNTYENIEHAKQINWSNGLNHTIKKYHFAKFVFATNESYDGNWYWTEISEGLSLPKLIEADLNIYSCEKYCGVSSSGDNAYYSWEFLNKEPTSEGEKVDPLYDNPVFGQKSEFSNKINPRIIHNLKTWQDYIHGGNDSTLDHCFVIVKDIKASNLTAPNTSELTFRGTMFGSNMTISNLYLAAEASNNNQSFGLFKEVNGATIKDLNLVVKKALANNINCVGAFAGYIESSTVINVDIDATDVVVQGKTMVGAFAGIINNSTIKKVNITANVNAGRKLYEDEMYNYLDDKDLTILTTDGENDDDIKYSYAGGFAGAILGDSNVNLVNISGNSDVIGYYVGSVAGIVGNGAKLTLASTKVVMDQYVRGYYFAGGLVGENRGTLDRCFVENEAQQAIDANKDNLYQTTKNYRNLTFFDEKISNSKFIGGLVGFNNGGKILNSYSKIDVRSTNYTTKAAGGLIGLDVGGEVNCCYATGSVINRYIVGGVIGLITNKYYLLGYSASESNSSRFNTYFATNYGKDNTELQDINVRGAYIASCDTDDADLTGKGKADLLITNTFASNKWIVNLDETYLSYTTGLFIGRILDSNSTIDNCFSSKMISSSSDEESNGQSQFKSTLNNYINAQILKGSTMITPNNIKLNSILAAIVDPENTQSAISGEELIERIEK
ncbi:MAG TPA: hypothetical protein DCO89_03570, partial [Clostridiales bacterium]|nr:hypothetical protein [Clostridiales bacterium]